MDLQTIEALGKKKYPNYLLLGQEAFLEDYFIKTVKTSLDQDQDLEISYFDLTEISIDQVIDEANTFSFFQPFRLIVVDNFSLLNSQSQVKVSDKSLDYLLTYIKDPNPDSVIIWRSPNAQVDKRKKLTKVFLGLKASLDFSTLTEKEVETIVSQKAQMLQLKIDKGLVKKLLERTLYQLSQSVRELEKLKTYSLSGQPINQEVMVALVPRAIESDVFELTKAILSKQVKKANQIYQDLLLQKHEPIAILALIASQFRLMIQVKILQQNGYGQQDMASDLGVHAYRVKLASQSSSQYPLDQLKKLYLYMIDMDFQLKTGQTDKDMFFSLVLLHFIRM
ncbi:TPA: DNA polymerase III subunit delta [Streptococcus suis]